MTEALAITMEFFSGTLVYVVVALLFARNGELSRVLTSVGCFMVAMIISAWWMLRGTKRVSLIFRKAFLLGAAEWIAIMAAVVAVKAHTSGLRVGVIVGISTTMAVICLIGYMWLVSLAATRNRPGAKAAACA